jgi:MFS family permease
MKTSPLLVAFITVAIDLLGFGLVLPLLPLYGEHFLSSASTDFVRGSTLGLLMSSFSAMQFLFAPAWGRLSDRIGRRPVLLVGLAGSVLFYALFAYATHCTSLVLLFVARIGAGIAGATIATAQAVIADCTPPERRAREMALIGMAFGIGFTLGPILGSFWVSDDPQARPSIMPGLVASLLSLAAFLFALVRLPETLPAASGVARPRRSFGHDLRLALMNRAVAIPLVTFFVATLAFANFEGTLARWTRDSLHFSLRKNFYVFAYIGFVLMVAQGLLVRRLVPRLGEVLMILIGAGLMLTGLFGLGLATASESLPAALGALSAAVVGFAFLTPSSQALISRNSSAAQQGEILGVAQSAGAIARILGPYLGNLVYDVIAIPAPYYLGGGIMAFALLLATRLFSTRKPDASA